MDILSEEVSVFPFSPSAAFLHLAVNMRSSFLAGLIPVSPLFIHLTTPSRVLQSVSDHVYVP